MYNLPFSRRIISPIALANRFSLVRDLKLGRPQLRGKPSIIYIESTNRCNLDCVMCPRRLMTRPEVDMSADLFGEIIAQLDARLTELIVLHSDGEPLVNPDIFEMIRLTRRRGIPVMTSTNATLLTADRAAELIDAGLDVLTISLDGTTADSYEAIRRGADFEKVIKNINRFLELKGSKPPFTIVQMIKMKENEHQVDEFCRTWLKHKSKNLYPVIKPMTDWFTEHPEIIDQLNYCDRPWFGLVVQSSGQVTPCVHDYDGKAIIGRLPDEHIYDVWNSPGMIALRRGIIKSRRQVELCRNCNATPPRKLNPVTMAGLTFLDMTSIARILPRLGYKRPKQY